MPSGRPRTDSARTREALLDAAERLFAANGIHAVSLRNINTAAGARNVSAAHYHFGSKEAVVAAVVARRMGAVAEQRLASLAAVETAAAGGTPELRHVVEAMVLPFLHLLRDDAQGADYVTFLARVVGEPGASLDELAPAAFWTMIQRFVALLNRALPEVPERVLLLRVRFVVQQTFVIVTELQRLARRSGTRLQRRDVDTIARDFVDYLVGGLAAPSHSSEARSTTPPRTSERPNARRQPARAKRAAAKRTKRR